MGKLIHKTSRAGGMDVTLINFSVEGDDLERRFKRLLEECDERVGLSKVARQLVFLRDAGDCAAIERTLKDICGDTGPVTTCVCQPPADGSRLAAELWAFSSGAAVERKGSTATAVGDSLRWGYVGGIETPAADNPYSAVRSALESAGGEVSQAGFEFSQMVRTWYYIGDILDEAGASDGNRYDRFNQARNEFYAPIWADLMRSPASTGIGMKSRKVALEGILLAGDRDAFSVTWVDNPLQTTPFAYDIAVKPEAKPSFSRAAAVTVSDAMIIFVSGTASVRNSQVLHPGDVEAQTRVTIENIETLTSASNLMENHDLPGGASLADTKQFRVYIKHPEDYEKVRKCCEHYLPDVPHAYLIADVCRPEWLVEIETVAAVRLRG